MALWLLGLLVACGPTKEDRQALADLQSELSALDQRLTEVADQTLERATEGALAGEREQEILTERLQAARDDLEASRACAEALREQEALGAGLFRGWRARCLRLAERGQARKEEARALQEAWTNSWRDAPDRLRALQEAHDALVTRLQPDAEIPGILDPVRAAHPARLPEAEARWAEATSGLQDVQDAVQQAHAARDQEQAAVLHEALQAASEALARAEDRTAQLALAIEGLDRVETHTALALQRASTYWLRVAPAERDSEGKRRYGHPRWQQVDADAFRRAAVGEHDDAHDGRVEQARAVGPGHGTLTLANERGETVETRTVRVPDATLRVLYRAWDRAHPDDLKEVDRGRVDDQGLPWSLNVEGRLVLARKPAGAWPEDLELVVPVEELLP